MAICGTYTAGAAGLGILPVIPSRGVVAKHLIEITGY